MARNYIMHRVPEYGDDGESVVRMRYFPLVTPAKAFAREQARRLGHTGWTIESLPRENVAELLAEHVPVSERWSH